MSKTIRELAKELKISRIGVESRIEKVPNFRPKYTKMVRHRIIVNDAGCKVLENMNSSRHSSYNGSYNNSRNGYIRTLRTKIADQQSQLRRAGHLLELINKHNHWMEEQVNRTDDLLEHEQELQLKSHQQNAELRGQIKRMSNNIIRRGVHPSTQNKSPRRGFWARLFGKK